jgi:folate-binding protein YgfZ
MVEAGVSTSLQEPGAVPADPPDAAVAGHFGEPIAEQRALERGPAVVDRSHRGVVIVEGPERLGWLHSLTTQALERLRPQQPTELLVLSPHGQVEHHAEVQDDGERSWLLVEPGTAPLLAQFLDSMRFMTRVEVRDASDAWATLTVVGQALVDVVPVPAEQRVVRPRRWPHGAVDVLVPRTEVARVWQALRSAGARPAGHDAFEALRVAEGVARAGQDSDHRTLVHEAGWVATAVHLDKGCYRGQETVARVHNLGKPPRRLVLLHLDGSTHLLPARGSAVTVDGRGVGVLTSAARHHELGPIGLAMLRRSVPDDAALLVGDSVSAAVERDVSSPTAPVDLGALRGR